MSRTEKDRTRRERWYSSPPRWFISHRWSAPDRMAARLAGQIARAEHRAGMEPDVDPPTFHHRQGAAWEWN